MIYSAWALILIATLTVKHDKGVEIKKLEAPPNSGGGAISWDTTFHWHKAEYLIMWDTVALIFNKKDGTLKADTPYSVDIINSESGEGFMIYKNGKKAGAYYIYDKDEEEVQGI